MIIKLQQYHVQVSIKCQLFCSLSDDDPDTSIAAATVIQSPSCATGTKRRKLIPKENQIAKRGEDLLDLKRLHAIEEHEAKMALLNLEKKYRMEEHALRMHILQNSTNVHSTHMPLSYANM